MSREELWCRIRVVCVVRMLRVRLGRWKESILVLSRVRGVMSYSLCVIGCAVMRIVGGGLGSDFVGDNGWCVVGVVSLGAIWHGSVMWSGGCCCSRMGHRVVIV